MLKMLKEMYEQELSRLWPSKHSVTESKKAECQKNAKQVVCEIGATMYQYRVWLQDRYHKSIEHKAIHATIESGVEQGWLKWSSPHRFDSRRGPERKNIILTEEGFQYVNESHFHKIASFVHSLYVSKPRRKRL